MPCGRAVPAIALLEAQDQPGGRVKTVILEDGAAYEQGGQFYLHGDDGGVRAGRAIRSDATRHPQDARCRRDRCRAERRVLDEDFLAQSFFEAIFDAAPDTPGSLLDWTLSLGLDADGVAMIKSGCEEILGRPIEELSFRSVRDSLTKIEDVEGNTMEFSCVEGLGTLAGLMAEDLGEAFRGECPRDGAGSKRRALLPDDTPWRDHVEAGDLRRQPRGPAPDRLEGAAGSWLKDQPDRFVAGQMRKIVMRYDRAFWLDSDFGWLGQTDDPSGLSVMDCSDAKGGFDVLTVFCGGTAAMALHGLSEAAALTKVMDIIEPMLGPEVRQPIRVVQTDWTDHPWVGGAYDTWAKPWDTHDPQAPHARGT